MKQKASIMYALPYGNHHIQFQIPKYFRNIPHTIKPKSLSNKFNNEADALGKQIQKILALHNIEKDTTVAIVLNDATRLIPNNTIIPPLLRVLLKNKIKKQHICFYIATGTHRPPTKDELEKIIPLNKHNYRTHIHDCDNEDLLTYLGQSSRSTPIFINKEFLQSDLKILTGHIEPHHFMGFSGGVKSAVIGLGGRKTIETNHFLLSEPNAKMGIYAENPMRMDIEEIGSKIGIDFALNVILDDKKTISAAFFGKPNDVMEQGIRLSKAVCNIPLDEKYDLAICSAGGYPKDINLYQAQKAISHACTFLKHGGVVILAAECINGFGNQAFENFVEKEKSPKKIINTFKATPFTIGPHKAFLLALQALEHRIIIVSNIQSSNPIKTSLFKWAADMRDALQIGKSVLDPDAKIAILPYATHVICCNQ